MEEQSEAVDTHTGGGRANGSPGAGQSEDEGSKVEEEGSTKYPRRPNILYLYL